MQNRKIKLTAILAALFILCAHTGALAAGELDLTAAADAAAAYVRQSVPSPQVGSIGGEWAVIGLARSGRDTPDEYFKAYYENVEKAVAACGGRLHERKYTEYSRVVIALTAIGKDPADVAGYNLLMPLGDYEKTVWQGVNGSAWALIALDCGNYEMPINQDADTQATREKYLEHILDCQLPDGGWALGVAENGAAAEGYESEPDVTGMVLQALAKYQDRPEIKQAAERALACMSARQTEDGGFSVKNGDNSEHTAQMLVALCELGISLQDERFVKNGNSLLDSLLSYRASGGGYLHMKSETEANLMASEQALYALAAAERAQEGKSSLYRMDDVVRGESGGEKESGFGLSGKHPDVQKLPMTEKGKTFQDIAGHENQAAIEALAARGIVNGKNGNLFEPDAAMTRAEFAAIVVKGLGLPEQGGAAFADVADGAWYNSYINTAHAYGIVTGKSETEFVPEGTVTREEAAVMTARAAALCGMGSLPDADGARDVLAGFTDYMTAGEWARPALAFCLSEHILSDEALELLPKQPIKRSEMAQMLYSMLETAKLL